MFECRGCDGLLFGSQVYLTQHFKVDIYKLIPAFKEYERRLKQRVLNLGNALMSLFFIPDW